VHFKFNTRLETPFWQRCRAEADLVGAGPIVEFYRQNGPVAFSQHLIANRHSSFNIEGFLVHLVGNRVPYQTGHVPSGSEQAIFKKHCADFAAVARMGMDVREALSYVQHANWQWHTDG